MTEQELRAAIKKILREETKHLIEKEIESITDKVIGAFGRFVAANGLQRPF